MPKPRRTLNSTAIRKEKGCPLSFALGCLAWAGFITAGFYLVGVVYFLSTPEKKGVIPMLLIQAAVSASAGVILVWMAKVIDLLKRIADCAQALRPPERKM